MFGRANVEKKTVVVPLSLSLDFYRRFDSRARAFRCSQSSVDILDLKCDAAVKYEESACFQTGRNLL